MTSLNALVGSRICHDLINPLGAIGNGIELLGLAGGGDGPEMDLLSDSVVGATAKLKFLRVAFGAASLDQVISPNEIAAILAGVSKDTRLNYVWDVADDQPRLAVRAALLAAMCLETALPVGGSIDIKKAASGHWNIYTKHDRLNLDPALWVPLNKNTCPDDLTAAQVQFGLLPDAAHTAGQSLELSHGPDWVNIKF